MGRTEEDEGLGDPRYADVDQIMRHGAGRLRDERAARGEEDADHVVRNAVWMRRMNRGEDLD